MFKKEKKKKGVTMKIIDMVKSLDVSRLGDYPVIVELHPLSYLTDKYGTSALGYIQTRVELGHEGWRKLHAQSEVPAIITELNIENGTVTFLDTNTYWYFSEDAVKSIRFKEDGMCVLAYV
jgi:hypothetical protein